MVSDSRVVFRVRSVECAAVSDLGNKAGELSKRGPWCWLEQLSGAIYIESRLLWGAVKGCLGRICS